MSFICQDYLFSRIISINVMLLDVYMTKIWVDLGGSRGSGPLFGPRCWLFNIGLKVGPPPGPPFFGTPFSFACRPNMDPPFKKSWTVHAKKIDQLATHHNEIVFPNGVFIK